MKLKSMLSKGVMSSATNLIGCSSVELP